MTSTVGPQQQTEAILAVGAERPWHRYWPAHVPRSIAYPVERADWILDHSAAQHGDRTAIRYLDHQTGEERTALSYAELSQAADRIVSGLAILGVSPGDRVGFYLQNSPAAIAAYFGTWRAGAVGVPCNLLVKPAELLKVLGDAGASAIIADLAVAESLRPIAATLGLGTLVVSSDLRELTTVAPPEPRRSIAGGAAPDDVALVLYTGGTTGEPKGAMLTHRNLVANALQFGTWYDFEAGGERCIATLPLSHSGGMAGVMTVPLCFGATILLFNRFQAATVASAIERYRATRFFGVPTMYVAILGAEAARGADLGSLRACRTNAAPLPPAVKEAFDRLVGHEVLIEGYGLTETSPLTHANPITRAKAGSIGMPLADTDAKIVDPKSGADLPPGQDGELVLRGPQVMRGYWGKPAATETALQGGWFHTGDIAAMDDDGYFRIVDRKKDVIITGGYKAWPREIEDVLYEHPGVALAAVVGVPDAYWGEAVKAFVVPRLDGSRPVSAEDLVAYCKERLANYKVPRSFEFRSSLPVSAAGKVLRRELRAEAARAAESGY